MMVPKEQPPGANAPVSPHARHHCQDTAPVCRLAPSVYRALEARAAQEGCHVTALVNRLLRETLAAPLLQPPAPAPADLTGIKEHPSVQAAEQELAAAQERLLAACTNDRPHHVGHAITDILAAAASYSSAERHRNDTVMSVVTGMAKAGTGVPVRDG